MAFEFDTCKRDGCGRSTMRENGYCRAHCPDLAKIAERRADQKYVEMLASNILNEKPDVAKHNEELRSARSAVSKKLMELGDAEYALGAVKRKHDEMLQSMAEYTDFQRLVDIYEVAKKSGDAATMERVNKSMYYAKRKAENA